MPVGVGGRSPGVGGGIGGVLSRNHQVSDVSEGGDNHDEGADRFRPPDETSESHIAEESPTDRRESSDGNGTPPVETDGEGGVIFEGYVVPTAADPGRETDWRAELADAGRLTASAVDTLVTLHGARGTRAIEAVSEKRVKRYRDFTVVVGYEDEYVIEDGGCTCKDSSYNLDPEDPNQRCWHVLAAAVAERIGEVDHHDMWYSDVREFL